MQIFLYLSVKTFQRILENGFEFFFFCNFLLNERSYRALSGLVGKVLTSRRSRVGFGGPRIGAHGGSKTFVILFCNLLINFKGKRSLYSHKWAPKLFVKVPAAFPLV